MNFRLVEWFKVQALSSNPSKHHKKEKNKINKRKVQNEL
jgi:hypothetical protein